jgi:hypothetical protein
VFAWWAISGLVALTGGRAHPPSTINCRRNLRQLNAALQMYIQDYNDRLPPHALPGAGQTTTLPYLLFPYIKNAAVFTCSEDPAPASLYDQTPGDTTISYGYNWHALSPNLKGIPLSRIADQANTVAFTDTFSYLATPGPRGGTPPVYRHKRQIYVAWMDGRVTLHPPGALEQTAGQEKGRPLGAGIDRCVNWNLK